MTKRLAVLAVIVVPTVAWLAAQGPPPSPSQTFRTSTDIVMVDVSVMRENKPVTGLTAADFELRDNGVRQQVETVETTAVPIDLSIVVDVSGNPDRPFRTPPTIAKVASQVDEQARKVTALLRAGDRVRLFGIDTYVQQIWPLQPAATTPPVRRLDFDGHASLYNTLTTLLLQPVEPNRRHVIVLATRGLDSSSSISAAGVRAIAERSDAQMHLVMREVEADAEVTVRFFQCENMDLCQPTTRFLPMPRRRLFNAIPITAGMPPPRILFPDGQQLKAAAIATGGDLYMGEVLSDPTLFGTFSKAFESFRQSYVLRYRPTGVGREGWHQLTVTVPRDKSLKVRARNGYAIDALPAAAKPLAAITESTPLRTLPELISAYERGAWDPVTLNLRQVADPVRLIADFDRGGNPWPGSPRREALFALELAESGMFSPRLPARNAAVELLLRFARLVRHPLGPDEFERAWYLAEVAMLQGMVRPSAARPFVDRALARFPHEPRLVLARAILTDQRWPYSGTVASGPQMSRGATSAEHMKTLMEEYEAAAAFPETRAEASIRLGWFLHRIGRSDEAIVRLKAVESVERVDRSLGYLRELLLGHVLASAGRMEDALVSYGRAISILPGAQAARVAMMNAQLVHGNRPAAEAMAETLQQPAPRTMFDPWWLYWQGDYRRYPQELAAARAMIPGAGALNR